MAKRTYEVEALITVEVDGDQSDARAVVDETLQRLWDRDHAGSKPGTPWHFELLDGGLVTDITEER